MVGLIIMDGLALNPSERGNAVKAARTPVLDRLMATRPWSRLQASGRDVGLMDGQMGDSNVGHLNLGAGRIVKQYVLRILDAIDDGSFFQREALIDAMEYAKGASKRLHVIGMVSPGGVHSHTRIVAALAELAKERGLKDVCFHVIMDGRDTPPRNGYGYLEEFESRLQAIGVGKIASVSGRYYAMDRDLRWERTKAAYDAIVVGDGLRARSALDAVRSAYDRNEGDEFIRPTVIVGDDGNPVGPIGVGDAVIFANFRADRARQLTRSLIHQAFEGFPRAKGYIPIRFCSMTEYDAEYAVPFAFPAQDMTELLGEVVARQGWRQIRLAETEKYAHVTYFFNGGKEEPLPGEDRRLIPSPKVATYDLQPEMSAFAVADAAVEAIMSGEYQLLVVNFANCDMVGHTGDFDAAVKAVETVDTCVGRLLEALDRQGGSAIVTADHGNADQMIEYETGGPHTFHTTYPVPCILYAPIEGARMRDGRLADIAPTLLQLLGLEKPAPMTGESLIVHD